MDIHHDEGKSIAKKSLFEHDRAKKSTVTDCVRSILSDIIHIWKGNYRTALYRAEASI